MKKVIPLIGCVFTAHMVNAAEVDLTKMSKQLDIMENIMKSSVGSESSRGSTKISSIESTYLVGQGIVFNIHSNNRGGHWGSFNFNYSVPPVPPVPPVVFSDATMKQLETAADLDPDMDIEQTIAEAMESAAHSYEQALDSLNENRHEVRELREEQRDLAYEMRDLERETRDLTYQMKRADKEDKKELEKQAQHVAKQKAKLKESQKAIEQRALAVKKKQTEQNAKREQQRQAYYVNLSKTMAETLCLYGNGLRELPKGERVTVILESAGDRANRGYKDSIHVYSMRDINACAMDKIDAAKLLKNSKQYQF